MCEEIRCELVLRLYPLENLDTRLDTDLHSIKYFGVRNFRCDALGFCCREGLEINENGILGSKFHYNCTPVL
jgi:hypothetical protein